jgi:hypothetical protein
MHGLTIDQRNQGEPQPSADLSFSVSFTLEAGPSARLKHVEARFYPQPGRRDHLNVSAFQDFGRMHHRRPRHRQLYKHRDM